MENKLQQYTKRTNKIESDFSSDAPKKFGRLRTHEKEEKFTIIFQKERKKNKKRQNQNKNFERLTLEAEKYQGSWRDFSKRFNTRRVGSKNQNKLMQIFNKKRLPNS